MFSDLFIVMRKELFYPSLLYFSVYLNSIPPFGERRKEKKSPCGNETFNRWGLGCLILASVWLMEPFLLHQIFIIWTLWVADFTLFLPGIKNYERDFRNDHLIHPSTAKLKCPLWEEGKHSKPPLPYSIPELPDTS